MKQKATAAASAREPAAKAGYWRRLASAVVLLGLLAQIGLFFIGLGVPVERAASLWGKSLEDRRGVVWGLGKVLKAIAEQFPANASIYLIYPQSNGLHGNSVYYFYPRNLSITMTNTRYGSGETYDHWNEVPDAQWLIAHKFDYVLSFQKGGQAWAVGPGMKFNGTP